jgi:hypothetical protein
MKKGRASKDRFANRDTLRAEYDFTGAVRGVTAARYARGTNIVAVDPEVRDVFPESGGVNLPGPVWVGGFIDAPNST